MKNWTRLLVLLCAVAILLWVPVTRAAILLILPLGSGIDDLIFFMVVAAIGFLLLARVLPVNDKAEKVAKWFSE